MDVTPYLELEPQPRSLRRLAAQRADKVRFRVKGPTGAYEPVTWARFIDDIRAATDGLVALGLEPGRRAAIFSENRLAWLTAAHAIQSAGAAMIPIYPASTAEQAAYVLGHAKVEVLFVGKRELLSRVLQVRERLQHLKLIVTFDATLATECEQDPQRMVSFDELLALGRARPGAYDDRVDALSLEDVGLILYTSGTSGPPKGVPLTWRNSAVNGRDWLVNNASLVEEGDVDLLWLPMSHIFGFGEAGLGHTLGFETTLCEAADILPLMQEHRPQVFMSVPSTWDKLATMAGDDPDALRALTGGRLRFCLSGGAGLRREVKERFLAAGLLIIEGYGLTEASPTLTMNRPDRFRFDSVGLPFPSVELRLADDGEIQARGPSIFTGYLDDAEASANAFTEDGWLKTGDLGAFTEDGFLQIVGRKKEILVTAGGKNVPPANIEAHFAGDPIISQAMVWGDGRKYLVAGFWVDPSHLAKKVAEGLTEDAAKAELRAYVAARVEAVNDTLARYETLKKYVVFFEPLTVDGGHLTSTLKLRRKPIGERFGAALDALYEDDGINR
jgi:long-chain acyl-CoA synthetase